MFVCWSETSEDSPGSEHKKDVVIAEWFTDLDQLEIRLPPKQEDNNLVSNLVQV